jgi:hypothetical protein
LADEVEELLGGDGGFVAEGEAGEAALAIEAGGDGAFPGEVGGKIGAAGFGIDGVDGGETGIEGVADLAVEAAEDDEFVHDSGLGCGFGVEGFQASASGWRGFLRGQDDDPEVGIGDGGAHGEFGAVGQADVEVGFFDFGFGVAEGAFGAGEEEAVGIDDEGGAVDGVVVVFATASAEVLEGAMEEEDGVLVLLGDGLDGGWLGSGFGGVLGWRG